MLFCYHFLGFHTREGFVKTKFYGIILPYIYIYINMDVYNL